MKFSVCSLQQNNVLLQQKATQRKQSFPRGFCNVGSCSSSNTRRLIQVSSSIRHQPLRRQHMKAVFDINRVGCCTKQQKDLHGKVFLGCFLNARLVSSPRHLQLSAPVEDSNTVASPTCPPAALSSVAQGYCSRTMSTPGLQHVAHHQQQLTQGPEMS